MDNCLPGDIMAVGAAGATVSPAVPLRPGRRLLMAAMLLIAAALDLTRCGLVLTATRYLMPTAGLVAAGLAAAGLTLRTARGCQAGQRWAGWAASLIGTLSGPQAAASGFRRPFTIPDTATATLGILLVVAILATAGRPMTPGPTGRPEGLA